MDIVLLGADLQADHISRGLDLALGIGEHAQAVIAPAENFQPPSSSVFFPSIWPNSRRRLPADLAIVDQVGHVGNINRVAEACDHAGGNDAAVNGAKSDTLKDLALRAKLRGG